MKPEPLVPADCDLRDLPSMLLDIRRLLTSETWLLGTADEKVAAVTLWCESWHQFPASSLPTDDQVLARLSRAGRIWPRLRDRVLRGWIECSDGRLYHPVVAEKALLAWGNRADLQRRTRDAGKARWAGRKSRPTIAPAGDPIDHPLWPTLKGCPGMDGDTFRTWFDRAALDISGQHPVLVCPSPFAADHVREQWGPYLRARLGLSLEITGKARA